jgi:hemicentin
MSNLCSLSVVLLTLTLSFSTKLLASADKPYQNSSAAYNSVSIDNICNNNEKNVAFDVVLIDNKKLVKRDVPQNGDKHKERPRADQKSLLIIFDGTGSMYDDLQQLRSGAQEIINDLSMRNDSPIFNYVLVVYRDPSEYYRT